MPSRRPTFWAPVSLRSYFSNAHHNSPRFRPSRPRHVSFRRLCITPPPGPRRFSFSSSKNRLGVYFPSYTVGPSARGKIRAPRNEWRHPSWFHIRRRRTFKVRHTRTNGEYREHNTRFCFSLHRRPFVFLSFRCPLWPVRMIYDVEESSHYYYPDGART